MSLIERWTLDRMLLSASISDKLVLLQAKLVGKFLRIVIIRSLDDRCIITAVLSATCELLCRGYNCLDFTLVLGLHALIVSRRL